MTKTIHWLSIAAIASVLLLVPIASTPVAFTDDDDDDDDPTKQCVDDCVAAFDDAMEDCDELGSEAFASCVRDALRALNNCIGSGGGGEDERTLAALPPKRVLGCLDRVAEETL